MFQLRFSTDNATFEGDFAGDECARILRAVAARIGGTPLGSGAHGLIRDTNGNRVGEWTYEPSADTTPDHVHDAAPALLVALKEAQAWLVGIVGDRTNYREDQECLHRIDAAIAKAEGRANG